MTQTSTPTVWQRWLALELRRLRQEADLSQADVARALDCHVPKISLIESTERTDRTVQETDLQKMLTLFEVPQDKQATYFDAVDHARDKGWWDGYSEHTIPGWHKRFIGLEQGAERLRSYQTAIFHGLIQTPEYAAAILRSGMAETMSEEKVARLVNLRIRRQEALWREHDPLQLSAIVDEAALRHLVGGRETMQAQLEYVADVVKKNELVTVQVIPFERGAAFDANYGPFTLLSFHSATDPGVTYIEYRSGAFFLDSIPEVDQHSKIFQQLQSLALPPDESMDMLSRTANEYRNG
jgi:transcriptional regulator with XRE-family HTH domain